MKNDSMEYVNRCEKCQRYGDVFNAPSSELGPLTMAWPFSKWDIDLLGPFHKRGGQVKFLIVVVDYLTKWIEAELLAKITPANGIKFFNKNILSRFGVPQEVITDNGIQFADKRVEHRTTLHFGRASTGEWTSKACQKGHTMGIPHHTTDNQRRKPIPPHLRDESHDSGRNKRTTLEDGTPARP